MTSQTAKIKSRLWYAINLTLNRDSSLYLDTAHLRHWLINHLEDKSVLNTFAYTGSLESPRSKGGASRVVQWILNQEFLNIAKNSYALNGIPIQKGDFISRDFRASR